MTTPGQDAALAADLMTMIETLSDSHDLPSEQIVTAMFACITSAAIHGGVARAQFLDLAGGLYDAISAGAPS
jgi:hypothetical protein